MSVPLAEAAGPAAYFDRSSDRRGRRILDCGLTMRRLYSLLPILLLSVPTASVQAEKFSDFVDSLPQLSRPLPPAGFVAIISGGVPYRASVADLGAGIQSLFTLAPLSGGPITSTAGT